MAESRRSDVRFSSDGDECAAWRYEPEGDPRGFVILGHGLGAVREMGLDAYADRFAQAGLGALAFTYRHFGDSGGEPRQLLDIEHQLADWAAALRYARSLEGVDGGRIALWGSSFGGGHVIEAAKRDGRVAAVVNQCPFTDGPASLRALGLQSNVRASPLVARDLVAQLLGRPPVLVPLIGPPGSAALMTAPDAEPGYRALIPPDLDFVNGVAARLALHVAGYRPGRSAAKLRCPILFCVCDQDSVAPAEVTLRYAAEAATAEVKRYPIGHFAVYVGEDFERAVADQTEFLVRVLG